MPAGNRMKLVSDMVAVQQNREFTDRRQQTLLLAAGHIEVRNLGGVGAAHQNEGIVVVAYGAVIRSENFLEVPGLIDPPPAKAATRRIDGGAKRSGKRKLFGMMQGQLDCSEAAHRH